MAAKPKRIVLTLTCVDAPEVVVSFEPEGAQYTLVRDDLAEHADYAEWILVTWR